jgi:YVTN family beta-propeller protein
MRREPRPRILPMIVPAVVTIIAAALLQAPPALADVLLVGNKSAHTAWALDTETGEKTIWLETGTGPHEIEVSPDGRYAVVSNYGTRQEPGNSLTVIDWQRREVVRVIDLGRNSRPHGMAFLPNGSLAVTIEGANSLAIVDIPEGPVRRRISVGPGTAHMVAASPDGAVAWVTNIAAGTLEKVDVTAGEVVATIVTGGGAEGVAVTPDGTEVWVTNRAADTVSVVDATSLEIVATLASEGVPIRIAFMPDGARALVTNARAATVSVFDVDSRSLLRTIDVAVPEAEYRDTLLGRAALPIGVEIHPDGRRAFVAVSGGDEVAVIDTTTWRIVDRWPTGREPDALGVIVSR